MGIVKGITKELAFIITTCSVVWGGEESDVLLSEGLKILYHLKAEISS